MKNILLLTLLFVGQVSIAQEKAYYRMPAIHNNWVLFTAEGDLWKYDINTNQSLRLTSHHGLETEATFSLDGKWIAFTGEYEGASELYLIASEGGVPKRLTFENAWGTKPLRWLEDGSIMYTTTSKSPLSDNQLMKLNPTSLATELIPLAQAADGDFDSSKNLFFTRFSFQGSHTKRYEGGTAQSIWKFSGNSASSCLTCDYKGTSREAMIYKDRVFFASDRDGTMNIWSMGADGKNLKQHTFSSGWDLFSPYIQGSKIVYQKGADIGLLDIEQNTDRILDIKIQSDFDQRRMAWIKNPKEKISDWQLSPSGKFVAIITRGRIFVSPSNGSRWVEVTRKSGIRYREVQFLDERTIAYLSDESGEYEIWKSSTDGSGKPQRLTRDSKVLITGMSPSPDGKYIAYADKNLRLFLYHLADGSTRTIEPSYFLTGAYSIEWTKDSKYFTYYNENENSNSIFAFEPATNKKTRITTDRLNSFRQQFSTDQKWLYFISERELKTAVMSPWGNRQPEPYFDKTRKIYALQLDATETFPFIKKDGWIEEKDKKETDDSDSKKTTDTKKKSSAKATEPSKPIDWSQAANRLYELPLAGKNIASFCVGETHLFWSEIEGEDDDKQKLYSLKIEYHKKLEPVEIADGINGFNISADRKKLILLKENEIHIAEANGEKIDLEKTKLDLSNWSFNFDPIEDWKQMFVDAWRLERDYFYDINLHGVDWLAIRKRYEPLVSRVTDRYELDHLIAQMVSELSALHTFVYGGDKRESPDKIEIGQLGAELVKETKGYRITHIYKSDPDYPQSQSPLISPHLKIKEGDVIIKINDAPVNEPSHLQKLLLGKVNDWVKLTLQNENETFDQLVQPISEEAHHSLRYAEWEYTRRLDVEKKSSSSIGYIHLRAMGNEDMNDFVKQFYPVFDRAGLILDVRHNGGGNIDSWVLEKLLRKAWFYWQPRVGKPFWNMQYAFRGHLVVLCDEATGSDGEAVTEGIRRLNLGTIIGTRTWGGEIWLNSSNRLVDNGIATAAEFGVYADGKWLIEGHGVDPDIIVDNEPYLTFQGIDTQLNAAIKFLQDKIEKEPMTVPKAPEYPNKSFKYKD